MAMPVGARHAQTGLQVKGPLALDGGRTPDCAALLLSTAATRAASPVPQGHAAQGSAEGSSGGAPPRCPPRARTWPLRGGRQGAAATAQRLSALAHAQLHTQRNLCKWPSLHFICTSYARAPSTHASNCLCVTWAWDGCMMDVYLGTFTWGANMANSRRAIFSASTDERTACTVGGAAPGGRAWAVQRTAPSRLLEHPSTHD
jgi:hypothetical protein